MIVNGNLTFHTLGDGELQNAIMERLSSDPTGETGRIYYNITSDTYRYHNGTEFVEFGTDGFRILDADGDTFVRTEVSDASDEDQVVMQVGIQTGFPNNHQVALFSHEEIDLTAASADTATYAGGAVDINAGAGNTSGTGGAITLDAGAGGSSGTGGAVSLTSGAGGGSAAGGAVSLTAGAGGATGTGGGVTLSAGSAASGFDPGDVTLNGGDNNALGATIVAYGATAAGGGGNVLIESGGGGTGYGGGAVNIQTGASNNGTGGAVNIASGDGVGTNRAGGALTIATGDATGSASGGSFSLTGGAGGSTGTGGTVTLTAGTGGATSGAGGALTINAGDAATDGAGGALTLTGGSGLGTGNAGGDINITSGDAGAGDGGSIILTTGNGTTSDGTVQIISADSTIAGELQFFEPSGGGSFFVGFKAPALAGSQTYVWPAADGTADEVLTTDGGGNLSFQDAGSLGITSLIDADSDTKIDVEEGADDDTIRMDVGDTSGTHGPIADIFTLTAPAWTVNMGTASTDTTGGTISLTAGKGGATSAGGSATLQGGLGGATSGDGGAANLYGGDADTSGAGGAANVVAGAGASTGGAVNITAGAAGSAGYLGGAVNVTGGAGNAQAGGDIVLTSGAGNGSYAGGALDFNAGAGGANGTGGAVTVDAGAGGATSGDGGAVTINAGDAATDGAGGAFTLTSGDAAGSNPAGDITITTGAGGTGASNDGGSFSVTTGSGGIGTSFGGDITFTAGDGAASGGGGDVTFVAGDGGGTAGTPGTISLTAGSSGTGSSADGSDVTITAGSAGSTSGQDGGDVVLTAGDRDGAGLIGAIIVGPPGAGSGETGEIRFRELAASGTSYVGLKAPDDLTSGAGSQTFTLPSADGTSGQVLQTDGSGALSFTTVLSSLALDGLTDVDDGTAHTNGTTFLFTGDGTNLDVQDITTVGTTNTDFIEVIEDIVGAMGISGTDTTFTYSDVSGTIEWSVDDVFLRNTGDTLDSGTLSVASGATIAVLTGGDLTIADAPVSATDAANKAYVDSLSAGLDPKESVRAATTASEDFDGSITTLEDETNYDGTAGNGTFTAGTGYAVSDTITLSDGSVITVDAVGGSGDVTQFTVTTAGTSNSSGLTLTQSSTSGGGTSFDLTPETNNITGAEYDVDGGTNSSGQFLNVDLASGETIDGINFTGTASTGFIVGDRVLVKNQTDPKQNGIYEITAAAGSPTGTNTTLTRAEDQDGTPSSEVSGGNFTFVEDTTDINASSTNSSSGWVVVFDGILTLNTDDVDWTQFTGAGSFTAGTGIGQSGNTIFLQSRELTAATVALDDELPFSDTSVTVSGTDGGDRNTTIQNFLDDLGILTTAGASPAGGNPLTASDGVRIDDAGTAADIELDVQNLSEVATASGDEMVFHDVSSAGTHIKRTITNFLADNDIVNNLGGNGIAVQTAADTYTARTITASAVASEEGVTVTDGDGVSGNPTIGVDITGQTNSNVDMTATDEFLYFDGTNNEKITGQNLADGVSTIIGFDPTRIHDSADTTFVDTDATADTITSGVAASASRDAGTPMTLDADEIDFTASNATAASAAAGGAIDLNAGAGDGAGAGGAITLDGGTAGASGTGGAVTVQGGLGGASSGDGGAANLYGGDAVGGGTGGAANVVAGTGASDGGAVNITAGGAGGTGVGGAISLTAGQGAGSGQAGGAISLTSGAPASTGNVTGSDVTLTAGDGFGTGYGGDITLTGGEAGTGNAAVGGTVSIVGGIGGPYAAYVGDGGGGPVSITGGAGYGGSKSDGGAVNITGGAGTASSSNGGGISLYGGTGTATGGNAYLGGGGGDQAGGSVFIKGAAPTTGGTGGKVEITAADGLGTSGSGGDIILTAGDSPGTGSQIGGDVSISAGYGGATARGGDLTFNAGDGGATSGDGGDFIINLGDHTGGAVGSVVLNPPGDGAGETAEIRFVELGGTNYTGLKAADTIGTSFTLVLPDADGSANQALVTDGSGALSFATVDAAASLTDADGDTLIQVEETADEDIVRIDVGDSPAGFGAVADIMTLASSGWTVAMGTATGGGTAGADIDFTAGTGYTTGTGGGINLTAGDGGTSTGGYGGDIVITAGSAGTGSAGDGGDIELRPGALDGAGTDGVVRIIGPTSGTPGEIRLEDNSGGQYIGLQAAGTISSSFTLTLPSADGSSGQALVTDGAGTLSFSANVTGRLEDLADVTASTSGTPDSAGDVLVSDGTDSYDAQPIHFIYDSTLNGGAATSHTVTHNLGQQYVQVMVTDQSTPPSQIIPQSVDLTDANTVTVTLNTSINIFVIVTGVTGVSPT